MVSRNDTKKKGKKSQSITSLPLVDNSIDSLHDTVGMLIKTQVAKEHRTRQDHGSRISLILALDIKTDVTATRLENGNVTTDIAAGNNTGPTDERSTDIREDTTVQVRGEHDVELLGTLNSLHRSVIDDHIVGLQCREVLGGLVESVTEETVGELHDVSLVDTGDLLAVIGEGEAECEFGDALGLGAGDDLEGLDDAADGFVLEAGVLALGVLTDDAQVDILVSGLVAGDALDEDDGGVDVEFLAQSDVEGLVAGSLDGGVEDTLETDLVSLEGGN